MPFQNGISIQPTEGGGALYRYGAIDRQGEFVLPMEYSYFGYWDNSWAEEGIARVQHMISKQWGVVQAGGAFRVDLQYDYIGEFHEGMACVRMGDQFGYINQEGEEVIAPQYENAMNFSNGLAGVCIQGKYGYIDDQGNMVIPPRYDYVHSFPVGSSLTIAYPYYRACIDTSIVLSMTEAHVLLYSYCIIDTSGEELYVNNTVIKDHFESVSLRDENSLFPIVDFTSAVTERFSFNGYAIRNMRNDPFGPLSFQNYLFEDEAFYYRSYEPDVWVVSWDETIPMEEYTEDALLREFAAAS